MCCANGHVEEMLVKYKIGRVECQAVLSDHYWSVTCRVPLVQCPPTAGCKVKWSLALDNMPFSGGMVGNGSEWSVKISHGNIRWETEKTKVIMISSIFLKRL